MLPFRLADVSRVEFYKRDELVSDLICCEVTAGGVVHFSHEEDSGWGTLVEALQALPNFDRSWFSKVNKPAFAECRTCAFEHS